MKRTLSAILCLVMVLGIALCMSACGGDSKPSIEGTWKGTWNVSDYLNEYLGEYLDGSGMEDYFVFSGITLDLIFEFDKEGKAKLYADESTIDSCADALADNMIDRFSAYFDANPDLTGGMSFEEFVTASGMTVDTFIDSALGGSRYTLVEQMASSVEKEGYYKLDGNKLYIEDTKEELEKSEDYRETELKGDTMSTTIEIDNAEIGDISLTFKKVK